MPVTVHELTQEKSGPFGIWRSLAISLLSLPALVMTSCVNCCPDESEVAPPESAFVKLELSSSAKSAPVPTWRTRSPGPPILLLHALNGISPSVLHWALEMESWGYRVYIPSLYGDPIEGDPAYGWDKGTAAVRFLKKHPEWDLNSTTHPGSIIHEVRALSRDVSAREGRADIAVIGNCLTGIFPLAILDEPHVRLAVISQPALPVMKVHQVLFRLPQSRTKREALPLSDNYLNPILAAMKSDPCKRIIGFHYVHDPIAPIVKFDRLHDSLASEELDHRFTSYILEKANSSYGVEREDWVVADTTEQGRKLLTPHSTLSNPESRSDRDWFRAQLRRELNVAWAQ